MTAEGSILVTGTNGTLGAKIVATIVGNTANAAKYHGLYTVRNVDGASNLKSVLAKSPKVHKHDVLALDLDRLQSVRDVANDIKTRVATGKLPPIRALIWNAGFQEQSTQTFTEDGFDTTFQANYLSHWLLTVLLLGSMDKDHGRVVVVGSWSHEYDVPYAWYLCPAMVPCTDLLTGWLHFSTADKNNEFGGQTYYSDEKWKTLFTDTKSLAYGTFSPPDGDPTGDAGIRRYGAAKLCEVMMIREMQERFDKDPVLSNLSILGVDPGGMPTTLLRRGNFWFAQPLAAKFITTPLSYAWSMIESNSVMRPASKSARDVLRAALESTPPPMSEHPKGLYFNGNAPILQGAEARDPAKTGALWRDSVKFTGIDEHDMVLKAWN
ncbi:hypothetical protein SPBR_08513 [Sporothrix brasiliensis 5110]|uniref:Short-chain dehydrogenase n=1 Tax=Sporothrix brasiliensis 5110 TaxID=1398154 RepID=A0A0C2EKT0_9PEZI|nr:uncharacterized protein SPBR_08513 [Sporothrix brasiliensis 5110]KIH86659.1 hypothetical protein SPBR_08513 [Sporothrix brasiliensis 5110]